MFNRSMLALAVVAMAATPAFTDKPAPKPVMVYAIAWDGQCGGNSLAYRLQMADSSNYSAARNALKKKMEEAHPNAKGVRAGSSKFDFGSTAGGVAVIEIDNSSSSCRSRAILVKFGVDAADASSRAIKEAGKRPYKILEQQYFVKVLSAPTP